MNNHSLALKRDIFKDSRGTWSRFYDIFCKKCSGFITVYQKDGPGELKRMYLDRIISTGYGDITYNNLDQISNLTCPHCSEVLWIPYVYEKENRLAMRLFVWAITKELHKKL